MTMNCQRTKMISLIDIKNRNMRWWALVDSNHRPPRYQHDALTNWAKSPRISMKENGGARRTWTDDILLAKQALYQLSYGPIGGTLLLRSKIKRSPYSPRREVYF